jgi:hypothetical protein
MILAALVVVLVLLILAGWGGVMRGYHQGRPLFFYGLMIVLIVAFVVLLFGYWVSPP